MTDLPIILPEFPTRPYTHLLPSLDRHGITVADLLSLDTLEIAKRASLPILDLRKLAHDVVYALHGALEVSVVTSDTSDELFSPGNEHVPGKGKISGLEIVKRWSTISFLDTAIDKATGGGIPTGYLTEITGERLVKISVASIADY